MWYEVVTGNTVRRHPCYERRRGNASYVVRSRTIEKQNRGEPLLDPVTGNQLLRYDHVRELRLYEAWRAPVLLGKMPACPSADDSPERKGTYAMFIMLLFRPWRFPSNSLPEWLAPHHISPNLQPHDAG